MIAATIETAYAIKYKRFPSLSAQQLVDCNTANFACKGGWADRALGYIQQYGLESEAAYPYLDKVSYF